MDTGQAVVRQREVWNFGNRVKNPESEENKKKKKIKKNKISSVISFFVHNCLERFKTGRTITFMCLM